MLAQIIISKKDLLVHCHYEAIAIHLRYELPMILGNRWWLRLCQNLRGNHKGKEKNHDNCTLCHTNTLSFMTA